MIALRDITKKQVTYKAGEKALDVSKKSVASTTSKAPSTVKRTNNVAISIAAEKTNVPITAPKDIDDGLNGVIIAKVAKVTKRAREISVDSGDEEKEDLDTKRIKATADYESDSDDEEAPYKRFAAKKVVSAAPQIKTANEIALERALFGDDE